MRASRIYERIPEGMCRHRGVLVADEWQEMHDTQPKTGLARTRGESAPDVIKYALAALPRGQITRRHLHPHSLNPLCRCRSLGQTTHRLSTNLNPRSQLPLAWNVALDQRPMLQREQVDVPPRPGFPLHALSLQRDRLPPTPSVCRIAEAQGRTRAERSVQRPCACLYARYLHESNSSSLVCAVDALLQLESQRTVACGNCFGDPEQSTMTSSAVA